MSLIGRLIGESPSPSLAAGPLQDIAWWGLAGDTEAGVRVSADTALKLSTVWACVGLLSETIASLPLVIFRWMENQDGRERARNHPLYDVLHSQPNEQQTAFEFTQMIQGHALLRGSGYARIKPGPRGFADQLDPLHPDDVTKQRLPNGRLRYTVQGKPVNAEDVFEVGGLTLDGLNTLGVINYARDSFGLGLAAEHYGARFFRNDSRPGGILRTDKTLNDKAAKRVKNSWEAAHAMGNQHRVAVLEDGLQWQQIGISNEDAQFLQSREFQAEDICRWFRVPPHMVGLTSKETSWGTGIENMSIGFVTYTLRPWLVRWSQAIARDLIIDTRSYFADFVIEGLLRGDIKTRYDAYALARNWGWMSVNDIRRLENMNPIPNGDVYLQPLNMNEAGTNGERLRANISSPHYRMLAEEAAARLIRKEIAAVTKLWERERGQAAWETAISEFYSSHANLVAQTMRIPLGTAVTYTGEQCAELTHGIEVMGDWETRRVSDLATLAMENGENHV